jgi:hypothetical protein
MHGASAVARVPGRIESVFYNTELSSHGIYALQIYVLGIPTTVIIDDSMPLSDSGDGIFAGRSGDGALWGMLLEKAFAKVNGTWESIIAGDPRHSINALTGAPATNYDHQDRGFGSKTAEEIFDIIKAAETAGNMVSASTASSAGGNTDRSLNGITQDHVYTVLGCIEVDGQKLIRIRNPWGYEFYQGPWFDSDSLRWTDALKSQVNYVNDNDGIFFIDFETFHSEFEGTQISYDTTDLKQAYYLVENDNTSLRAESSFCDDLANNCGSYRHEFTVTSSVEQTVHLNTYAWPERSYPGDCTTDWEASTSTRAHFTLYTGADGTRYEGDNTWYFWRDHNFMPSFEMEKGAKLTVKMEMDWSPNMSRDFSLVAWSTDTAVDIVTTTPETTPFKRDAWPLIERQSNDMNAASESGADDCFRTPQQMSINTFT